MVARLYVIGGGIASSGWAPTILHEQRGCPYGRKIGGSFPRLEWLRVSLAKHEVSGKP